MADVGRVQDGIRLRHVICGFLLEEQRVVTVPDNARAEAFGLSVQGRSSKTASDALRWEVRKGRVIRLGGSLYQTGSMPRSTEWWIRRQLAAYREIVAPIPASVGMLPPTPAPVRHHESAR